MTTTGVSAGAVARAYLDQGISACWLSDDEAFVVGPPLFNVFSLEVLESSLEGLTLGQYARSILQSCGTLGESFTHLREDERGHYYQINCVAETVAKAIGGGAMASGNKEVFIPKVFGKKPFTSFSFNIDSGGRADRKHGPFVSSIITAIFD